MNEKVSKCEICGAEIDLAAPGWLETDTGDICAECVAGAEAAEDAGAPAYYAKHRLGLDVFDERPAEGTVIASGVRSHRHSNAFGDYDVVEAIEIRAAQEFLDYRENAIVSVATSEYCASPAPCNCPR